VHLEIDYPDVERDLNRWLPLVKWLLALPHYIVLFFLAILAFFAVILAWVAILITGRYPSAVRFRRRLRSLGPACKRLCLPPGNGPLPTLQPELM